MTTFYIVRHGHSVANEKQIFAGISNFKLSQTGEKQAELVSDYVIKNLKIDAIYSSELSRAQDTVKKASEKLEIPIIPFPAFNEVYGGKWEGVSFAEIYEKYPNDLLTWLNDIANSRCTEGESFKELKERTFNGLIEIANKHENQNVLIATHAGAIRALLCKILNLSDKECNEMEWVSNASITTVCYDNGVFKVERLSYDDYLASLKTSLPANI